MRLAQRFSLCVGSETVNLVFYVSFFTEDHKTEVVQLDEADFVLRT
jgi:hypothetical protein